MAKNSGYTKVKTNEPFFDIDNASIADIEKMLGDAKDDAEKEVLKKISEAQKKSIKDLAVYKAKLEKAGLKSSFDNEKKLATQLAKAADTQEKKLIKQRLIEENKERMKMLKETSTFLEDVTIKMQEKVLKLQTSDSPVKKVFGQLLAKFSDVGAIFNKVGDVLKNIGNEVNSTISKYSEYAIKTNARLQGTGMTFATVSDKILSKMGASPYVKTEKMLDTLQELISSGIAFNVEQRAFLATISDNIASTFNAFDSNLLRLIKLQQQDITASRLGLEGYLTSYLNSYFLDTSYLSSEFDTVSSSLLEASSQMSASNATAFEYVVQKWLGSLSSVGLSSNAVSSIAQALGYLGSGNVSALSGTEMGNLLVMSAARMTGGKSYAEMLTQGLDASNTNKLLKSMVEYLGTIASTSNQVVKSQYASLFGISVSDLTAVANLLPLVDDITKSMMSYQDTLSELANQFNMLDERIPLAARIQNLISNAKFSLGANIADNPALASVWAITDLIQSVTGGINIPTLSVMGTYVDLNTTVENLMKTAMIGVSTLSTIGDIFTGLGGSSNLFSNFNLKDVTRIKYGGSGLTTREKGVTQSLLNYIGNQSASAIYEKTLADAYESAKQSGQETTENPVDSIKDYLLTTFDSKMNRVIEMLAASSGFAITPASESEVNAITWDTTSVVIKPAVEEAATNNANNISNINMNVAEIRTLLESVISQEAIKIRAAEM